MEAHAGRGRGLRVLDEALAALGEGLVNVGEGGRRHGAYDTAPHTPEVTSSTKRRRISERVLSASSLTFDYAKTLLP